MKTFPLTISKVKKKNTLKKVSNPSLILNSLLAFLTLFLSACNFNETYVRLLTSTTSTQAMKVVQTEEVTGGFSETTETGVFSCEYGDLLSASQSCNTLTNFIFDNAKGTFSWTPSYQQIGNYRVVILSPKGLKKVTVIVVEKKNESPVLTLSNVGSTALENDVYSIDFEGTDINEDELTYSYECLSSNCGSLQNISFDESAKTFSFSTDYNSEGSYSFLLKVSDGTLENSKTFNVDVLNVNRAPSLAAIGDKNVDENVLLSFDLTAVDLDGDSISYSCGATCPTGMSISGNSVSWTPTLLQSGTYSVTFSASDGSLVDSETISIEVNDTNQAPVLSSIGNQTVTELEAITPIDANDFGNDLDSDGEAITYACYYDNVEDDSVATTNLCSTLRGASFNTSTGVLAWTTAAGSPGLYEFKILASDGALSDEKIFTIMVESAHPLTLTYRTTVASTQVWLPVHPSYSYDYNYKVDWGDNSALQTTTAGHTYTNAGTYTIRIYGTFPRIYYSSMSASDKNKIIEVNSLGKTNLVALTYAFNGCINLASFTAGETDTSNLLDMTGMFQSTPNLVSVDLNGIDSSKVTSMYGLFMDAARLASIDLSMLNTSNVTNMSYMFYGTTSLESLDLSMLNTAKVTNMSFMFFNMSKATTLNVSGLSTASATDMSYMFSRVSKVTALDVSSFTTEKVTLMQRMFYETNSLVSLDISHFDTVKVTNMSQMFMNSGVTTLDLHNFNAAAVTDMSGMLSGATKLNELNLRNWVLGSPNVNNMFDLTPAGKVVYCTQNPVGNTLGVTCTP